MAFTAAQIPTTAGQVGSATTVSKAFANNPTPGNLVVAIFLFLDFLNSSAGTVAIKDGNNNSFTITPNSPSSARSTVDGLVYFAYLIAPANAEKTITCTYTNTSVYGASLWVQEYGVSGGTPSFSSDVAGTGSSGTAINTPTVTAAGADTLMIAAAVNDHAVSSVDSPWTQVAAGAGNQFSEGVGYILSTSSNTAVAMTENISGGWDSLGAAFAFTPSGGSIVPVLMRQYRQRRS